MKFSAVADIDRRGYGYLCAFALVSCLSMAAANVFLGLAIAALLHRCLRERPQLPGFWDIVGRPAAVAFFVLAVATIVSIIGGWNVMGGVKRALNHYAFWPAEFLSVIVFVRTRAQVWRMASLLVLSLVLKDRKSVV